MKYKNEIKSGFSLLEALVSMLILSIFFLASSRVITQKKPTEVQENPQGYYECYIDNGTLWQHISFGDMVSVPVDVTNSGCTFDPPVGVNFYNVHYINNGEYLSSQQVIMNERVNLGGPGGIDRGGVFDPALRLPAGQEPDAEQMQSMINRAWQFHAYLEMTHPGSNIYTIWEDTGEPPAQATMISW